MPVIADALVLLGACILGASLVPVRRIVAVVPPGGLRRSWYVLGSLIAIFIAGYLAYPFLSPHPAADPAGLIVPAVFFLGACFVWIVSVLSLKTTLDVRRVASLERENITDPLTGVYNRRFLERSLQREFAKAGRHGIPLSVLVLDLDHFKQINDRLGHQAGDRVLKAFAEMLVRTVRDTDTVSRYGGEEFVVIAPFTGTATAATLAERLRASMERAVLLPAAEHGSSEDERGGRGAPPGQECRPQSRRCQRSDIALRSFFYSGIALFLRLPLPALS